MFIRLAMKLGGDRRRRSRRGDRFSPHTVLKIRTSFAVSLQLIRKLPLTMRLDPKRNILASNWTTLAACGSGTNCARAQS